MTRGPSSPPSSLKGGSSNASSGSRLPGGGPHPGSKVRGCDSVRAFLYARARLVVEPEPGAFRALYSPDELARLLAANLRRTRRPGARRLTGRQVRELIGQEWPPLAIVRGEAAGMLPGA